MSKGLIRVFLWNIESGGKGRHTGIANAILKASPDIVVLNEYRVGTSDPLITTLQDGGLSEFHHSNPPSGYGGVAVLSREKLKLRDVPAALGSQAYRCLPLELPSAELMLWAVYAPYKDGCAEFWEPMLDALRADLGRDAVLIGDLNAGQDADLPTGSPLAGIPYVHQIHEMGYRDLWASCHNASEPVQYTWRGTVNPYRIDHAFGTSGAASRVRAFEYKHADENEKLSDHSSLTLELTPKPLARAGSQRWLQVAVNTHRALLDQQILDALGAGSNNASVDSVEWISPLEQERYVEYRDGATIEALGLDLPPGALHEFWPSGGPVWDGLARVGDQVLLLEAKAHIPEMLSPGTRATGAARDKILATLNKVRGELVPKSEVSWDGAFYQYANRIAHLHFLREQRINAHLVYVYFLNAPDVDSPATQEEWDGATTLMESVLGIRRTRLSRYIHKIFLDVRGLDSGTVKPAEM